MVFDQERKAVVDGKDLSDFDLDIKVSNPSEDIADFELKAYNIPESFFRGLTTGESTVAIDLGWADGPMSRVMEGIVEDTESNLDGNDKVYVMRGHDASARALTNKIAAKYKDQTPDSIASDLASKVGLGVVTDSVGTPIDSYFSTTEDKQVAHYLGQLTDYAGQFTGVKWTYRAAEGKLYFIKDTATPETVPKFSYDSLLASIGPKGQQDQDTDLILDFTAALDPRLKNGAQVRVDTKKYSGNFEVLSFEYQSSSVNGDHLVTGSARKISEPASY